MSLTEPTIIGYFMFGVKSDDQKRDEESIEQLQKCWDYICKEYFFESDELSLKEKLNEKSNSIQQKCSKI